MHNTAANSLPLHGDMLECPDCGLLSLVGQVANGNDVVCPRCDNTLRTVYKYGSLDIGLAWAITAAVFYILSVTTPMMQLGVLDHFRSSMISSGPGVLDDQGFWALAAVIVFTTMVAPLLKIGGTLVVLVSLRLEKNFVWLAPLYGLTLHITAWIMIEVFLLGFLVAYSRAQLIGHVHLSSAVFGMAGLMVAMSAMSRYINHEEIWSKIKPNERVESKTKGQALIGCDTCCQVNCAREGDGCTRCGEILHLRKPNSIARTWAFTIAAAVLYIPSNIYPVMNVTRLGVVHSYTIFGGLQELDHIGMWPLAILIFIASMAIPVFKLLGLVYMLDETHRKSSNHLIGRTKLFLLVDFIGRWSMVDVFVVSILVALVRFGWLTQIQADIGVVFFASVVLFTLLAVKSFDPRLMWDAAFKRPSTNSSPILRQSA